jgi:hypothetical protein
MSEIESAMEKKINKTLDKIIGTKDEVLREVLKITLTNDSMTPEIENMILSLREQHMKEAHSYLDEMNMTMDDKGNIVEIISTKTIEDGNDKTGTSNNGQ